MYLRGRNPVGRDVWRCVVWQRGQTRRWGAPKSSGWWRVDHERRGGGWRDYRTAGEGSEDARSAVDGWTITRVAEEEGGTIELRVLWNRRAVERKGAGGGGAYGLVDDSGLARASPVVKGEQQMGLPTCTNRKRKLNKRIVRVKSPSSPHVTRSSGRSMGSFSVDGGMASYECAQAENSWNSVARAWR